MRKNALIPLREISDTKEIDKIVKSNANSLLFIMPLNYEENEELRNLVNYIQNFLSDQTLYIPVYFIYENEEINQIVEQLKSEYETGNSKEVYIFL